MNDEYQQVTVNGIQYIIAQEYKMGGGGMYQVFEVIWGGANKLLSEHKSLKEAVNSL